MSNNSKELRGQLRQIIKEILPELLSKELENALYKKLESRIKESLDNMNQRHKDVMSYLVRSVTQVDKK